MAALEDITRGAVVRGILPNSLATISDVRWIGTVAIEVTYKDASGRLGNELLYRDREPTLEIVECGRPWSFDGDSALFRLLSEANRIRLAYLFDPLLAVHTSLVEPLPHQITAVYGELLARQPLRFLLADDPGAGKTIMTGLLIKELIARGDLQRVSILDFRFWILDYARRMAAGRWGATRMSNQTVLELPGLAFAKGLPLCKTLRRNNPKWPDFRFSILDFGFWILDFGFWITQGGWVLADGALRI